MSATRHAHWGDDPDRVLAGVQPWNWRAPTQEPVSGVPFLEVFFFNTCLNDDSSEVSCSTCSTTCQRSGRCAQRWLVGGHLQHGISHYVYSFLGLFHVPPVLLFWCLVCALVKDLQTLVTWMLHVLCCLFLRAVSGGALQGLRFCHCRAAR